MKKEISIRNSALMFCYQRPNATERRGRMIGTPASHSAGLVLNSRPKSGYFDRGLSLFPPVPPGKCRNSIAYLVTGIAHQLSYRSTLYNLKQLKMSLNKPRIIKLSTTHHPQVCIY
jgi:hypothetical protein